METIQSVLDFGNVLSKQHIPYVMWTGNEVVSNDILYCESIPSIQTMKHYGVNCAGFINILRHYAGRIIPESPDSKFIIRGGTLFWYHYFEKKGVLDVFDYTKEYPIGTLFIRNYNNNRDQGHLSVLIEHSEKDPKKTLHGKIVHSYQSHDSAHGGEIGITNLGMSHFSMVNEDGSGYYTHVVYPEKWILED